MITVRYPSGLVLTYNDALVLMRGQHGWALYRNNDEEGPIAFIQASAGATVEFTRPCDIDQGGMSIRKVVHRLAENPFYLQDCSGRDVARLKRALRDFDLRSESWK